MNPHGRLVIIEGPDGIGKTTLVAALTQRLLERGLPAQSFAFPGNDPGTLGHLVYRLHHETGLVRDGITPAALQTLHVAAHLDTIERRILPALRDGKWVLLDRYWWSTWVYGQTSGVPQDLLEAVVTLERLAWSEARPWLALLLVRSQPWRQSESSVEWRQVADSYAALAAREGATHPIECVSNDQPLETVAERVLQRLMLVRSEEAGDQTGPFDPPPRSGAGQAVQMTLGINAVHRASRDQRRKLPSKLLPAVSTSVFDTYWRFATERQAIFFHRLEGGPPPWTDDPILVRHKFTNTYRASDRVSQYLIRHVIYSGDQSPEEVFFRVLLFKFFNRIDTWELLTRSLGSLSWTEFSLERYGVILTDALRDGQRIYSPAYIMPAADRDGPRKHMGHLRLLERMMRDELPHRLSGAASMRQAFELLRGYSMMGDFLAYQYLIDLNYSTLLDFSEMEFVVPGPGARSGIRRCFRDLGGLSEADLIRLVAEQQDEQFMARGLHFPTLFGRKLQLVDCQNLFCEVDKYARVAHPEAPETGRRTRIKQIFRFSGPLPAPWYPPKWGLNERIHTTREEGSAPAYR